MVKLAFDDEHESIKIANFFMHYLLLCDGSHLFCYFESWIRDLTIVESHVIMFIRLHFCDIYVVAVYFNWKKQIMLFTFIDVFL